MQIVDYRQLDKKHQDTFKDVYKQSFPLFEQRTGAQFVYALTKEKHRAKAYLENDQFIGFIVYWEFDHYLYIEHLAMHPQQRGKNYGSAILTNFLERNEKMIILEIDPLVDEVSRKRYDFYHKLGFTINPGKHTHPAYRTEYEGHALEILTSNGLLNDAMYKQFSSDLINVVMTFE